MKTLKLSAIALILIMTSCGNESSDSASIESGATTSLALSGSIPSQLAQVDESSVSSTPEGDVEPDSETQTSRTPLTVSSEDETEPALVDSTSSTTDLPQSTVAPNPSPDTTAPFDPGNQLVGVIHTDTSYQRDPGIGGNQPLNEAVLKAFVPIDVEWDTTDITVAATSDQQAVGDISFETSFIAWAHTKTGVVQSTVVETGSATYQHNGDELDSSTGYFCTVYEQCPDGIDVATITVGEPTIDIAVSTPSHEVGTCIVDSGRSVACN